MPQKNISKSIWHFFFEHKITLKASNISLFEEKFNYHKSIMFFNSYNILYTD